MSIDHINIWSLAETYVSGNITDTENAELQVRLQSDSNFAAEFHEAVNLVRSLTSSGEQKRFRSTIKQIGEEFAKQKPVIKFISFKPHYWRIAAMAATIALLVSFGAIWMNRTDKKNASDYTILRHEIENIKRSQSQLIANIKDKNSTPPAQVRYTGTGFALSNNGYLVTNYHVVEGADSIYIQNHDGDYFKASVVAFEPQTDIAILKVEDEYFRFAKADVPYTFAQTKSGLAARVFTLGFPQDELIYNEGYISGENGFNADTMQYRLEVPSEPGQSGSPVLDESGNVLAIVTAHGGKDEGNTYAVSSIALLKFIHSLPKEINIRLPKANKLHNIDREEQVGKLEYYTCSVKVYK